jgi:hypothetical protein|tara:strand:- start:688 stop:1035 length:348 start_codon:yes stop_codon:yes gene_type:complete
MIFNIQDALIAIGGKHNCGLTYDSLEWLDEEIPKPTEAEINAKIAELQKAEPMRLLREERNRKLAETDWRASSDLTLSSEWSTYRQALRDLPSTATPTLDEDGNLQNVTWPSEPT